MVEKFGKQPVTRDFFLSRSLSNYTEWHKSFYNSFKTKEIGKRVLRFQSNGRSLDPIKMKCLLWIQQCSGRNNKENSFSLPALWAENEKIFNRNLKLLEPVWLYMNILNRWSGRKSGLASNPLFIIPGFSLHFPWELSYGYLWFKGNMKIPLGR